MSAKPQASSRTKRSEGVAVGRALQGLLAAVVRSQSRDMSLTSLSTLSTLDQTGPRRITDLAVCEGVAQPTMTALVSTLERSGLVERRADPDDKRVVLVALSTAGQAYIRTRQRAVIDVFAQLVVQLPTDQVEALVSAIPALTHLQTLDEVQRNPSKDPSVSPRTTGM
jgi:DNA-binding MarR family transcriptional regulator